MRLNRDIVTFGRHETFPLRYGWLTKGAEAIIKEPMFFNYPEKAMVKLGVGRNMVNAIQYWLHAVGIVTFKEGTAELSPMGDILFGNAGDCYLEDEATLWIIHWLLASNAENATGVYWFFNYFALPRFYSQEVLRALIEYVELEIKPGRSRSTLKSDVSTLLRLYAPDRGRSDEHLDSPLATLRLIEIDSKGGYRSPRTTRPYIPPVALHFALAQRFEAEPSTPALPVRNLLFTQNHWAAPGAIFRLSEEGMMAAMVKVMDSYPGCYELRDTAGLNQIYRGENSPSSLTILRQHYLGGAA